MAARKPKPPVTPEPTDVDDAPVVDRGPGPDQAETRASRWDTPRST